MVVICKASSSKWRYMNPNNPALWASVRGWLKNPAGLKSMSIRKNIGFLGRKNNQCDGHLKKNRKKKKQLTLFQPGGLSIPKTNNKLGRIQRRESRDVQKRRNHAILPRTRRKRRASDQRSYKKASMAEARIAVSEGASSKLFNSPRCAQRGEAKRLCATGKISSSSNRSPEPTLSTNAPSRSVRPRLLRRYGKNQLCGYENSKAITPLAAGPHPDIPSVPAPESSVRGGHDLNPTFKTEKCSRHGTVPTKRNASSV